MGSPFIVYNGKTITFPQMPHDYTIDANPQRTILATLTGDVETIVLPRVLSRVVAHFRPIVDAALRLQLHNWWQYAAQGNSFTFGFDSAKTVKTTLTGQEAIGETTITVASATGIAASSYYVLIGGPNYQLCKVSSIAGAPDIVINTSLDFAFAAGSIFRDQYYWTVILREPDARCPIQDLINKADMFQFSADFVEAP